MYIYFIYMYIYILIYLYYVYNMSINRIVIHVWVRHPKAICCFLSLNSWPCSMMMYDEVCWRCTTLFGKSPPTVVGFDSPRNTKQTTMTQWHYYWRRPFPNKKENHISHTTTCSNAKSFLSFEILAAFGNSVWPTFGMLAVTFLRLLVTSNDQG